MLIPMMQAISALRRKPNEKIVTKLAEPLEPIDVIKERNKLILADILDYRRKGIKGYGKKISLKYGVSARVVYAVMQTSGMKYLAAKNASDLIDEKLRIANNMWLTTEKSMSCIAREMNIHYRILKRHLNNNGSLLTKPQKINEGNKTEKARTIKGLKIGAEK